MQARGLIRKLMLCALVVGAAGAFSGCVINDGYADRGVYDDDYRYPPARPVHGYRYAYPYHTGLTLVFDSGLGMYGVAGYPDYYFHDGYFYRWNTGYWNRSRYWNRDWRRCDSRYWPRPVYHVHNNYYVKGRRPQRDWDRDWDRDGNRNRGPGPRDAYDDHADRTRNGNDDRQSRFERGVNAVAEQDQQREAREAERRAREQAEQELRQRSREANPRDERRHLDGDESFVRNVRRVQAEQAAANRVAAERAAAERAARQELQRAEQAQRRAAEQAERASRESQRQQEREERERDDARSSERDDTDTRGGERGDNWRSDRR